MKSKKYKEKELNQTCNTVVSKMMLVKFANQIHVKPIEDFFLKQTVR